MTSNIKVLEDLLGRLEAAEGPERELSFAIDKALIAPNYSGTISEWYGATANPHPTRSLDAALALVERVLPGCKHETGNTRGKPWCALFPADLAPVRVGLIGFNAYAATEPNAILCALITALISNADSAGPQDEGGIA